MGKNCDSRKSLKQHCMQIDSTTFVDRKSVLRSCTGRQTIEIAVKLDDRIRNWDFVY